MSSTPSDIDLSRYLAAIDDVDTILGRWFGAFTRRISCPSGGAVIQAGRSGSDCADPAAPATREHDDAHWKWNDDSTGGGGPPPLDAATLWGLRAFWRT